VFNQPLGGNEMPRFGGPGTMMRLPAADSAAGLDACFVGIPMDIGTSLRAGTRFGPRQIRAESLLIRPYNMYTRAAPFDSINVADIGDVPINTFDLKDSVERITRFYDALLCHDTIPLTLGGDHTLTYPVLRAIARKHGPVALVHVDAHADINEHMFGEAIAHGTPFRRAFEDGLLDAERVFQIGLRGTGYTAEDFDTARDVGERPVYLSFDIDSLDPSFAPGTGTPEIAGLTPPQALQLIRGLRGLNLVGCDLVEVSPPYDMAGTTALTAANLLYEMLCILPGVQTR